MVFDVQPIRASDHGSIFWATAFRIGSTGFNSDDIGEYFKTYIPIGHEQSDEVLEGGMIFLHKGARNARFRKKIN